MKIKHLIAKLINCKIEEKLFGDKNFMEKVCDEIVEKLNMKFSNKIYHKFNPLAIHT